MGWMITVVIVVIVLFLLLLSWRLGELHERRHRASREEAIRAIARRDGCEWSLDFWKKHMNQTEWNALYEGHWDTKESS